MRESEVNVADEGRIEDLHILTFVTIRKCKEQN